MVKYWWRWFGSFVCHIHCLLLPRWQNSIFRSSISFIIPAKPFHINHRGCELSDCTFKVYLSLFTFVFHLCVVHHLLNNKQTLFVRIVPSSIFRYFFDHFFCSSFIFDGHFTLCSNRFPSLLCRNCAHWPLVDLLGLWNQTEAEKTTVN